MNSIQILMMSTHLVLNFIKRAWALIFLYLGVYGTLGYWGCSFDSLMKNTSPMMSLNMLIIGISLTLLLGLLLGTTLHQMYHLLNNNQVTLDQSLWLVIKKLPLIIFSFLIFASLWVSYFYLIDYFAIQHKLIFKLLFLLILLPAKLFYFPLLIIEHDNQLSPLSAYIRANKLFYSKVRQNIFLFYVALPVFILLESFAIVSFARMFGEVLFLGFIVIGMVVFILFNTLLICATALVQIYNTETTLQIS